MPLTRIGRWKVHSIIELDYQQGNETVVNPKDPNAGTQIDNESGLIEVGNVKCYAPNLKGFVKEKTKVLYYKANADGTVDETPEEVDISDYLSKSEAEGRTITKDSSTYEFYNYEKQIWANIKVDNNGAETYWVWIPRYAYKINGDNIEVVYIDIKNNIAGTNNSAEESGYTIHTAFNNNKKGIWASKYELSEEASQIMGDFPYYIPDVTGFDLDKTYVEIYKDDGTFEEVKLSTISNISEFSKKNRWFDYEEQIWANIRVDNDGIETWWVWIPRYAYNIAGDSTQIIFLDTNDNPLSGEDLPSNYIVHSAFNVNNKKLKGIWVSKYELGQDITERETTNNVNIPDMTGFNPDTTWIEVYNDDGTFEEVKLSTISNIEQFARANRWYDYSNQIWANIKTKVGNAESWWVWIPRYAYNITGDETTIIFLDANGNPKDGNPLPANYIPHPGFEGKSGIWASKYEMSEED